MTCQCSNFLHCWVFPNNNLVKRVTMSANNFVYILREHQIAYLRTSVNAVHRLQSVSVPKSYTSISSTSSRGQKTILMRTPSNRFYCSCMF